MAPEYHIQPESQMLRDLEYWMLRGQGAGWQRWTQLLPFLPKRSPAEVTQDPFLNFLQEGGSVMTPGNGRGTEVPWVLFLTRT